MAKQQTLNSPYGDVTIAWNPTHVVLSAPHTEAGDWALGWWHGREWAEEAYFARAFWRGELGAGAKPTAAKTELDTFIAAFGFKSDLTLENDRALPATRARVQAYAQGFNQGRRRSKETPWTAGDCYLLARTHGFLEWWETLAPLGELALRWVQEGMSWDRLADLFPGLGSEPDREQWAGLHFPSSWSDDARTLVQQLRRFRRATAWTVPAARSANGRPLLAFNLASDVTEPGLPLRGVRIEVPGRTVRGLSIPGHPGFLAGRHRHLAWQAQVATDSIIRWRIRERNGQQALTSHWVGSGQTGTLESLLLVEESLTVEQAREQTATRGTAPLDWAAIDSQGQQAQWEQGLRWLPNQGHDAWLPAGDADPPTVRRRERDLESSPPGRPTVAALQEAIVSPATPDAAPLLAALRFLLPDNETGRALRRWTPSSASSDEAVWFERMLASVWDAFWEPLADRPRDSDPAYGALLAPFETLVQTPHSSWFPSADKNRRLAEAVRKAFSRAAPPPLPWLGRRAVRPYWKEHQGNSQRVFAATVAGVVDLAESGWRIFLTDDETETPVFTLW